MLLRDSVSMSPLIGLTYHDILEVAFAVTCRLTGVAFVEPLPQAP